MLYRIVFVIAIPVVRYRQAGSHLADGGYLQCLDGDSEPGLVRAAVAGGRTKLTRDYFDGKEVLAGEDR